MDSALSTNLIDLWSFSFSDKGLYEPERDALWKHRNREGPGVRTPSRAREKQSYGCERDDSPEAERYKSFKLYFIAGISHNHKMATFREAREALMFAYQDGSIDDRVCPVVRFKFSENLEFPYWKYGRFDLDSMTDDECKAEFRFYKNDIYLLGEVHDIPDIMKCPGRWRYCRRSGGFKCVVEAFCISVSIWRYGSSIRETSSTTFHDYKPNNGLCIR